MSYNPFSLVGKTILVTGASSGIGKSSAIECSKMGASVIITGRDEERLSQTFNALEGNDNKSVIADITTSDGLNSILSVIDLLDGIVLCAGVSCVLPFSFASKEKFDVNFNSPVELLRLLVKKKKIAKGASIVFVSSVGGVFSFPNGGVIYGASKAALSSVMHYCAIELASKNIRANCICPGMVNTPLIKNGPISQEQLEEDMKNTYPLGRYGQPEEIAYAAIYLLSDASAWVTGHNLVIDGGGTIN